MNAGTLLLVVADVITMLKDKGLIGTDGTFGNWTDLNTDLELVSAVEVILKKYGVATPDKLDKLIQLIPLIVELIR